MWTSTANSEAGKALPETAYTGEPRWRLQWISLPVLRVEVDEIPFPERVREQLLQEWRPEAHRSFFCTAAPASPSLCGRTSSNQTVWQAGLRHWCMLILAEKACVCVSVCLGEAGFNLSQNWGTDWLIMWPYKYLFRKRASQEWAESNEMRGLLLFCRNLALCWVNM